jgi:HK97 family phage major capsid protein
MSNALTLPAPRGLATVRVFRSLAVARGDPLGAWAFAQGQGWHDTPAVVPYLRGLVDALDTDSGAALVSPVGYDFAELLRPLTILGRLAGIRRVPFQTQLVAQTGGSTAYWAGQGRSKPLTESAFAETVTLGIAKVTGVAVVTDELVRLSTPAAEATILRDLSRAVAQAVDQTFIDPAQVAVSGISPASVTSGATPTASTGSSLAQIDTDLGATIDALIAAGSDLATAQWVLHPRTASYLSRLRGTGGALAYPTVTATGGTLLGLPVVTSANLPVAATTGEPTIAVLIDGDGVLLADDRDASLTVATSASVEVDTAPTSEARSLASLWQQNMIGLRAERFVNWMPRRSGAVQYVSGVTY